MGGLIARAYLSGLQDNGWPQPPASPRIRKLILIATPNFGSFYAANFSDLILSGTQASQMIPGSGFLWDIATWNQRGDDLRGVDALAIVGNGGPWTSSVLLPTVRPNESDGVVSLTSASLGFTGASPVRTRILPYCHTDAFSLDCTGPPGGSQPQPGIANVDEAPETGEIIFSFLADTTNWLSIGGTPATDPYLSEDGGMFFAWVNSADQYVTDLTQAYWGGFALQPGGDAGTIVYDEFVSEGTATFQLTSSSLGSVSCGSFTEPSGYYSAVRCKSLPLISSVTPRQNVSGAGLVVTTGGTISINGSGFGQQQCSGCQVLWALSQAPTVGYPLQLSSWSNGAITAYLPATLPGLTLPGLVIIYVELSASAFDSINIMAVAASACDVTKTGNTNVSDVQLIIDEALGVAPAVNDLNGDGVLNVTDVQIVINAAVGLGCSG